MIEKIIIAGAGGQGIMLLGKVLAQGAMRENKHVTLIPAYGAEVRGGTAHCRVVVSDTEIGLPYFDQADTLIVMNKPSLDKFQNRLKNKGMLILNSSLALLSPKKNARALQHPFTDIAVKLGNIRVANMVALGCLIAHRNIVQAKSVLQVIEEIAPQDKQELVEINKKALEEGMKLE